MAGLVVMGLHPDAESVIHAAVKEAWGHGYQTAVDTLRAFADETHNKELAAVIRSLAVTLESTKP